MNSLHIIVCIKQVPDPEAPISGYRIDSETKRVIPVGVPPVISPFDENALELALRLKQLHNAKITALSAGSNLSQAVLRKALFVGADELILIDAPALDADRFNSRHTAHILFEAIKKIGAGDIVLTGRQASDTNAGVVGLYLAKLLSVPAVTLAKTIVLAEGIARIERTHADGLEIIETCLPALITIGSEAGELRSLNMKQMQAAKKKPVQKWIAADFPAVQSQRNLHLKALYEPKRERPCFFIEAETPAQAGEKLALKLKEDNVI